jgi:hypothetical protein
LSSAFATLLNNLSPFDNLFFGEPPVNTTQRYTDSQVHKNIRRHEEEKAHADPDTAACPSVRRASPAVTHDEARALRTLSQPPQSHRISDIGYPLTVSLKAKGYLFVAGEGDAWVGMTGGGKEALRTYDKAQRAERKYVSTLTDAELWDHLLNEGVITEKEWKVAKGAESLRAYHAARAKVKKQAYFDSLQRSASLCPSLRPSDKPCEIQAAYASALSYV